MNRHSLAWRSVFAAAALVIGTRCLAAEGLPIADYLNPDGTLNLERLRSTHYEGTLDLSGFSVQTGGGFGAPIFRAEGVADASRPGGTISPILAGSFSTSFNSPGTNPSYAVTSTFYENGAYAATLYDGSLVLAGNFRWAGTTSAQRIVKWNGSTWTALGTGIGTGGGTEVVYALTVYGTDLIAGGTFTSAGGNAANYIAKWNGSTWSALGTGLNGSVYSLAVLGSSLVAGGSFSTAGGSAASNLASWNGTTWSAFGNPNGAVNALLVDSSTLYVGGAFTTMNGANSFRVASWNGTSWSAMGSGLNGPVNALALKNGVVAGGSFTANSDGSTSLPGVSVFNGTIWTAMGSGLNSTVTSLLVRTEGGTTYVYAAGWFTASGGASAIRLARWNGSSWSALSSDYPNGGVFTLADYGGNMVIGGGFHSIGSVAASSCAKWNGSAFSSLVTGNGVDAPSTTFCLFNGNLVCGGTFATAGGGTASSVASWDGTSWSQLGTDLSGIVNCLCTYNSELYAGGLLADTPDPGSVATGVKKWNGSNWVSLGFGLNDAVYAMAVYNSELYVGGAFTTDLMGNPRANVARWNGTAWNDAGTGVASGIPRCMTVYSGNLVVGGTFQQAGGITSRYLAKWNGSTWSKFHPTLTINNNVYTLQVDGTNLYAGGAFTAAGGVTVNRIACWNGSAWSALGSGCNNNVWDIEISGGEVVAAGSFTTAGGVSAPYLAHWNGSTWASVSTGLAGALSGAATPIATGLAVFNTDLYVAGNFTSAGGAASSGVARYVGALSRTPDHADLSSAFRRAAVTVPSLFVSNPLRTGSIIRFATQQPGLTDLTVFDVQGRQARKMDLGYRGAGRHEITWDGQDDHGRALASGVYFVRITNGAVSNARTVTVVR